METTVKYSFGFRAIVAAINLFHITSGHGFLIRNMLGILLNDHRDPPSPSSMVPW